MQKTWFILIFAFVFGHFHRSSAYCRKHMFSCNSWISCYKSLNGWELRTDLATKTARSGYEPLRCNIEWHIFFIYFGSMHDSDYQFSSHQNTLFQAHFFTPLEREFRKRLLASDLAFIPRIFFILTITIMFCLWLCNTIQPWNDICIIYIQPPVPLCTEPHELTS